VCPPPPLPLDITGGLRPIDLAARRGWRACEKLLGEYHMHHGVEEKNFDSVLFLNTLEGLKQARVRATRWSPITQVNHRMSSWRAPPFPTHPPIHPPPPTYPTPLAYLHHRRPWTATTCRTRSCARPRPRSCRPKRAHGRCGGHDRCACSSGDTGSRTSPRAHRHIFHRRRYSLTPPSQILSSKNIEILQVLAPSVGN